jgi:hypothetical protein
MTTLQEQQAARATSPGNSPRERRQYRRHDFEHHAITIERWDGARGLRKAFGKVVDLSAGGVRIRTATAEGEESAGIQPDQQVRVRLELPAYAGICPFIDTSGGTPQPRREWTGWMAVARVTELANGEYEVAGRLVDMEEMDRGMLGLYLSTQPLAA